jgi:hypothetical protein
MINSQSGTSQFIFLIFSVSPPLDATYNQTEQRNVQTISGRLWLFEKASSSFPFGSSLYSHRIYRVFHPVSISVYIHYPCGLFQATEQQVRGHIILKSIQAHGLRLLLQGLGLMNHAQLPNESDHCLSINSASFSANYPQ